MKTDFERLLDELIEYDPDLAERFIEKHLARIQLRKRLQAHKEKALSGDSIAFQYCRELVAKQMQAFHSVDLTKEVQ